MKPHERLDVAVPAEEISMEAFNVASVLINTAHDAAIETRECPGCVLEAMQILLNNMPEKVWASVHNGQRKKGMRVLMIVDEEEDEIGDTAGCA